MSRIEMVGTVDDQHRLSLIVPDEIKAGPIKVILEPADDNEDDWFQGVAAIWAREYDRARTFTRSRMESPSMKPSEIHLALFPYGGTIGAKVRPVLALTGYLGPVPEVVVAYISSILPTALLATDI